METLEDVIKEVETVGEVGTESGIEHILNAIVDFEDSIDHDTYRVLDYLVFEWEYGKTFAEQTRLYQDNVRRLLTLRFDELSKIEL